MRADTAGNLSMCRRGHNVHDLALPRRQVGHSQHLGSDAIVNGEATRTRVSNVAHELALARFTAGSASSSSRNTAADMDATRQLDRASTLAERGLRSMAAYSPTTAPGPS